MIILQLQEYLEAAGYGNMKNKELAEMTGLDEAIFVKFRSPRGYKNYLGRKLMNEFCYVLNCQPGDLMVYVPDGTEIVERPRAYRTNEDKQKRPNCRNGHLYSGDNLQIMPNGYRRCMTCYNKNEATKRKKAKDWLRDHRV